MSFYTKNFSTEIKKKLGIYLYIKKNGDNNDKIYDTTIRLKEELEKKGLTVKYNSKDDALKEFDQKIPNIINNLEKYGIPNPLPPILYVMINNNEDKEKFQKIIIKYEDIIESQSENDEKQQIRIENVINLTNFFILISYFLIFILVVIILAFLVLIIRISFNNFYNQIEIEKLLGAFYYQIKLPFLISIFVILLLAFGLMYGYYSYIVGELATYFSNVFDINILNEIVENSSQMINMALIEIILIFFLGIGISDYFLNRLISKV